MKKAISLLVVLIFYFSSLGQQWQSVGPLGFSSVSAGQPQLIFDQLGTPLIQYYSASTGEVFVDSWNGTAWQSIGSGSVTPTLSPPIQSAQMAVDNSNNIFLTYKNGAADAWKCGVKMWNGSAWIQYGPDNFSPGQATFLDIAVSSTNEVYVMIADQNYKLSVMKHNGASWVSVGNTYITPTLAYASSLALDQNDTPYVCYSDSTQGQLLSLIKFNGTSWAYEGSPGISPAASGNCDLLFDANNDPVVAYRNNSNNRLYVISDNGSGWSILGGGAISSGSCWQPELGMNGTGVVHVTCRDDGMGGIPRLWKYAGSSWDLIGGNLISTGLGDYPTVAFDANDVPFVGFRDNNQSGNASVMSFCATEATLNITTCQSPYTSPSGNHTYFGSGAYKDTIQNVNGCDSVLNINLTMNTSNISANAWNSILCDGDSTPVFVSMNGTATYSWSHGLGTGDSVMIFPTVTDTYTVVGNDGTGCIDTAEITIQVVDYPIINSILSDSMICVNDSVNVQVSGNGVGHWMTPSYPTSGSFPQDFWITNVGPTQIIIGAWDSTYTCESMDSLELVVGIGPSASGGQIGVNMWVNDNGFTYEWFLDGNLISGADSSTYVATQNGDYTVVFYDSLGCSNLLNWTISDVGLGLMDPADAASIYPNPFNESLYFLMNTASMIVIRDLTGKVVYYAEETEGLLQIDAGHLSRGTYLLTYQNHGQAYTRRIVKQ